MPEVKRGEAEGTESKWGRREEREGEGIQGR